MIELIQFPWSPYCLVQRHRLEYSGVRYKISNLPLTGHRSRIWKLAILLSCGMPLINNFYFPAITVCPGRSLKFKNGIATWRRSKSPN